MSSKEIITILKRLDLPVNNHMSVMENQMVSKVEGFFREIKENAAVKRSNAESSAAKVKSAKTTTESTQDKKEFSQENRQGTMNSINTNDNQKREEKPEVTNTPSRPTQSTPSNSQGAREQQPRSQSSSQSRPQSSQSGSRPQGSGQSRPQGQGSSQSRPQGQGRPQGSGQSRPQGQGSNQSRPQGQSGGGNRPQGSGQGGQSRPYNNNGGQSSGNRPQGGGQSSSNRPTSGGQNRSSSSSPAPSRAFESRFDSSRTTTDRNSNSNSNYKGRNSNNRFEDGKSGSNFRNGRNNKGRGGRNNHQNQPPREKIDNTPKKIIVRGTLTVGELAKLLHKDASEVIKKLLFLGVMATINQEVDMDAIMLIATEYGVEVEVKIPVEEDNFETFEEVDDDADLVSRPPVVTIMGHVDHGKTTLLDSIRKTNVTTGEAGGITQHIGAYQVEINNKKITFLDTPGHEAFTLMRARGAQVTDITIIVVAADDGIMPQTIEAISHAKAAGVPIIVAVNKIDKPDANIDKIKQEMTEYELVPEEWGGDTIFVEVSAKQRIGIENLLEMILLVAEMNEFKANPNKRARGTVIEAELDKGKGPVARILVQSGTLKVGDAFVAGNCFGRVRAMVNDKGRRLKEAGPSTPVEITGLTEVPLAGDPFMVFEDERKARAIADRRAIKHRQSEIGANTRVTLEDLYTQIKEGEMKDLHVIIKSDVQGSAEALKGSLAKIDVEGVRVKIIHSGAGAITESDVNLASASNAIVIGFNVRPEPQAEYAIEQEKVDVRLHTIIYKIIDEIEQAMKGLLDPIYKEVITGHAEVRNIFKVTKVGSIAGCMVTDGKMVRNGEARVIRDGIVVYTGKIESLKRFKDDAKEVTTGFECGITLDRFNDVKESDIIESFVMETVER
ncbi:MAG: translation initiation factor IF-2 [Candidatus Pristimantibacillus lignocellulolyticus]|uniref:Translation initiation factor IF-2 n=1 Tax=Candidatus Pristimantibacillus lignocellulolyticus TaxID=2994561 RepID=A0A9J6ZL66_9BACL|nr:MAG: translation initiation factor IF-2 [Candidatus Pristimantibacillus lignocellulolyticus]